MHKKYCLANQKPRHSIIRSLVRSISFRHFKALFLLLLRRAPQQKLWTHCSLNISCATLWWRWRERSSFFLFFQVMEHRWNETDRGKPKYSGKTLSQCQFVHHKPRMDWPGIEKHWGYYIFHLLWDSEPLNFPHTVYVSVSYDSRDK
jgi:hypothetical protein